MKRFIILLLIVLILGLGLIFYFYQRQSQSAPSQKIPPTLTPTANQISPTPTKDQILTEPVAGFKSRITKKPFGIYISPENSPVQSERFRGFHTGVDVEYEDVTTDVPVYAIADGKVVLSKTASGYGGVFLIEIELDNSPHTILYGHIRPSTLPKVGQEVTKGEQLAVLGTGLSSETDGERKHLHFAILSDNRLDIKGYTSSQNELSGWLDPLSLFESS